MVEYKLYDYGQLLTTVLRSLQAVEAIRGAENVALDKSVGCR